jgi:cytochrome d ubiquinol oxidase subunit I
VQILFQTWHLMIGVGFLLAAIMVAGVYLLLRKRLEYSVWYLRTLTWAMPLPVLACLLGWMTTEVGRQPWIVQGELRTVDAVSATVGTGQVATTLGIFVAIYAVLFFAWLYIVRGLIRKGPETEHAPAPEQERTELLAVARDKLSTLPGYRGPEQLEKITSSRRTGTTAASGRSLGKPEGGES